MSSSSDVCCSIHNSFHAGYVQFSDVHYRLCYDYRPYSLSLFSISLARGCHRRYNDTRIRKNVHRCLWMFKYIERQEYRLYRTVQPLNRSDIRGNFCRSLMIDNRFRPREKDIETTCPQFILQMICRIFYNLVQQLKLYFNEKNNEALGIVP